MANFGNTSVGCSNKRKSRGHLLGCCDIIPYEINLWTTGKRRESNNSKFADSERNHNACPEPKLSVAPSPFTVLVFNFRQVSGGILSNAEKEADEIFDHAGIKVVWQECPTGTEPCR